MRDALPRAPQTSVSDACVGSPAPSSLRLAAPALILSIALLAPFLHKAFTIDDTLFLRQAGHALIDPLHPTAFEIVWSDVPERLSAIMPSGPIMAYLLLPALACGGVEWLAHLTQLAILCVGIVATVRLARRLRYTATQAMVSGLLLAASPAVLGMAATAMPDVPAMALGVLGIERYLAFLDARRLHQGLFSALFLAAAALSRSHAGLLLGVAALFAGGSAMFRVGASERIDRAERRRLLLRLWPIAAALVLCAAVLQVTRDPLRGTGVVSSTAFFFQLQALPVNLLSYLTGLGLTVPLVIPWWLQHRPRLSRAQLWIIAALFLALLYPLRAPYLAPLPLIALICLRRLAADALTARDPVQLALVAWLCVPLPIVFYIHFAPKYLVPSAPAVALLMARALVLPTPATLDSVQIAAALRVRRIWVGAVGAGALLGFLIVRTDAAFADLGRRATAQFIAPAVARGERVWFAGHWGFQWYAERAGARPLTATPPYPQPGDLLVACYRCQGQLAQRFPHRQPLAHVEDRSLGGRIMATEVSAAFYSNGAGLMPWMLGTGPLDRYDLYRIVPPTPTP